MDDIVVYDASEEKVLKLETKVRDEDPRYYGIVTGISDPDGDVDDETRRTIMINPKVTVTYKNGDTETFDTTVKTPFPYLDDPFEFVCEDLEVFENGK